MTQKELAIIKSALKVLNKHFPLKYDCKEFNAQCFTCLVGIAKAVLDELIEIDKYCNTKSTRKEREGRGQIPK